MSEFTSPLVTEGQAVFILGLMASAVCGLAFAAVIYAAGLSTGLRRIDREEAEELRKDL